MKRLQFGMACALLAGMSAQPLHARKPAEMPAPAVQPVDATEIENAIEARRYDQAKAMIERAKLARQDDPRIDLALAEYWLATGSTPQAAVAFQALAATPGVRARALQGQGVAAFKLNRLDEAEASLKAALAADPGLHRAWTALGATADRRGDWTLADKAYGEALKLSPQPEIVRLNRGYSLLIRHRYAEAITDLTAAVTAMPNSEIARNNLRIALALAGRYEEAFSGADGRDLFRQLNNVGYAALMRGDLQVAEGYFNRAIEMSDIYYQPAHSNLVYLEGLRRAAAAPATKPGEGRP